MAAALPCLWLWLCLLYTAAVVRAQQPLLQISSPTPQPLPLADVLQVDVAVRDNIPKSFEILG